LAAGHQSNAEAPVVRNQILSRRGCKPAPSIKLATNSAMYKRMEEDMDVNLRHHPRRRGNRASLKPAHF
jgi:hypothetical protein